MSTKQTEDVTRHYEAAIESLFDASREAHAVKDDFLAYLIHMAITHSETSKTKPKPSLILN